MSFADALADLAPPYQQGPNMRAFYGAIGAQLDANRIQILNGMLAANPYAGGTDAARSGGARMGDGRLIECEPYVLPIHAFQRGIPLYATEGELSQRIRLSQWLMLRRRRGTHLGELLHARPYFSDAAAAGYAYPVMRIVHQDGAGIAYWHTMSSAGVYSVQRATNFNYDGQTAKRSRFWVFIEMQGTGYSLDPILYDGGSKFDGGQQFDTGSVNPFSGARMADVVQMFLDWKSAHSWLGGVILVWGTSINPLGTPTQNATGWWSLPNGTWGSIVDSSNRPTRPPYMSWIFDNPA